MKDIQECPEHNETCDADCEYYTELWDENELKEELDKGRDMKLFKLPFMIIGFIIVTAATMFIMIIDWLLRAMFGEDY